MSKVLEASCVAGIVKVGLLPVVGTTILSEGVGASTGLLVLEEDTATYVAKTTPDVKTSIERTMDALEDIASVLNTIATTLTSIGAGMTGPTTAPPGTLATDVATIVSKATEITATRTLLSTLKESLK